MSESGEKKDELQDQIRKLVNFLFEQGGLDCLNEGEDLFYREAVKIRRRRTIATNELPPKVKHREKFKEIIGNSPEMLKILSSIEQIAASDIPVLIQGESGTGKELIAKAIHKHSKRKDISYVAENCAALPETLLESELFGYKKGAFTGANSDKAGLFNFADGGTLFLDEIGDMSVGMQKKLLRALQDGEIRPVGSNKVMHVDVRLISASNKNLRNLIDQKQFRKDLFYRLNTVTLMSPPLRDRVEDIPDLCAFFTIKIAKEIDTKPFTFSKEALDAMARYRWPGNIRELENEVRRCMALAGENKEIVLDDLSDDVKNCY